eukprot:gene41686-65816_t
MPTFDTDHAVVEIDSDAQRDCFCQQAFVNRIARIDNRRNAYTGLFQSENIVPAAIVHGHKGKRFADGDTVSAKDFGFHSTSDLALQPATELFDACFISDQYGPKFPITAVAVRLPAIPHLYFIAFYAAMSLAYAKDVAGADESTLEDIQAGMAKAIDDI